VNNLSGWNIHLTPSTIAVWIWHDGITSFTRHCNGIQEFAKILHLPKGYNVGRLPVEFPTVWNIASTGCCQSTEPLLISNRFFSELPKGYRKNVKGFRLQPLTFFRLHVRLLAKSNNYYLIVENAYVHFTALSLFFLPNFMHVGAGII